jgi:hypothetical protein
MKCNWCHRVRKLIKVMLADRGGGYVEGNACSECKRKYKLERYDPDWTENY